METVGFRKEVLDKGFVELNQVLGNDATVVASARVSYLSQSKGVQKDTELIRYLIRNRHTSPFEHVVFQFIVKCPLFVSKQWMRHRTWSFNEVSRRYTSEEIDFYIPEKIRIQSEDNKQCSGGYLENPDDIIELFKDHTDVSIGYYNYLLNMDVAREQARMVLPQNLYTSFYGTVDLHNLFHFLELRNHPHAQEEIRVYAQAIEELIEEFVPISFREWKNRNEK